MNYWFNFVAVIGISFLLLIIGYIYSHLKFDFRVPAYNWKQKLLTAHWTEFYQKLYDYTLNKHVTYAKHAISIDENRKDFKRVGWDPGETDRPIRDALGNIFFEQIWFAGNHADVGGGYAENECRLSDVTLKWMFLVASMIPNGIKYDPNVLKLRPAPDGIEHDEVKVGFGLLTKLTGYTWFKKNRELPENPVSHVSMAAMHPSVYQRFDLKEVLRYDSNAPYRPDTLRNHVDFAKFYTPAAPFPSNSTIGAVACADDPEIRAAKPKQAKEEKNK
jgi:hypothetical protein